MSKLLSVITVCMNSVSDLERTIKSVVECLRSEIEYLVIDGASTDGTCELLSKYRGRIDVISSESDRGIYDAMNKGVSMARGEYVIFINSGDILLKNGVDKFIGTRRSLDIYFFKYKFYLPTRYGDVFIHGEFRDIHLELPTCHNAIFFRRSLFLRFGGFSDKYKIVSDYEWLVRTHGYTRTDFVEETVVLYLKGGFSETMHLNSLIERVAIAVEHFGLAVLPLHIMNFLKVLPVYLVKRVLLFFGLFEYCFYLRNKKRQDLP